MHLNYSCLFDTYEIGYLLRSTLKTQENEAGFLFYNFYNAVFLITLHVLPFPSNLCIFSALLYNAIHREVVSEGNALI